MRASRTYGSMRGAPSNGRPYRNRQIANRFTSIAPRVGRYHVGANLPGRHIDTAPDGRRGTRPHEFSDGCDHKNRLVRRDIRSMSRMSARLNCMRPLGGGFMALRVARRQGARSVGGDGTIWLYTGPPGGGSGKPSEILNAREHS